MLLFGMCRTLADTDFLSCLKIGESLKIEEERIARKVKPKENNRKNIQKAKGNRKKTKGNRKETKQHMAKPSES